MLSLPKLLLLLIVAGAAWYGWRVWQRKLNVAAAPAPRQAPPPASATVAQDLVKCPKCGTYVAAGSAHQCTGA